MLSTGDDNAALRSVDVCHTSRFPDGLALFSLFTREARLTQAGDAEVVACWGLSALIARCRAETPRARHSTHNVGLSQEAGRPRLRARAACLRRAIAASNADLYDAGVPIAGGVWRFAWSRGTAPPLAELLDAVSALS
jgi:hypothetical protein